MMTDVLLHNNSIIRSSSDYMFLFLESTINYSKIRFLHLVLMTYRWFSFKKVPKLPRTNALKQVLHSFVDSVFKYLRQGGVKVHIIGIINRWVGVPTEGF